MKLSNSISGVVVFFIMLVASQSLYAQAKPNYKEMYLEAESYMLFEEYLDALPLYLELNKVYPDNYNFCYRIGECYLNVPYEKEKSIDFLEKAVKNISSKYKEDNFNETKAPLDALYLLGNAYRINNQLDKAVETYKKFKNQLDPEVYNVDLVNDQIRACGVAAELMANPIYVAQTNLGNLINDRFADINPVVNSDETVMVFTSRLRFYDAVFYTRKEDGKWIAPINLTPDLGIDGECYSTSISSDGRELYLYKSDDYQGNIYVSKFQKGNWSKVIKLNDNINTKYWESHAAISHDGRTLYFTSNRKGGIGGLDIYKSTRSSADNWGPATNLGPNINTPYNEDTPFPTEDGKVLYFSSYGHYNMGGYDIFYSNLLDNNTWSVPVNLGYPINTTDDDVFFCPVKNGTFAYYSKYDPEGFGRNDIFRMEIFSGTHPRKFNVKGVIAINGDLRLPNTRIKVSLLDYTTGDTVASTWVSNLNDQYLINAIAGNYRVVFEGEGLDKKIEKVSINQNNPSNDIIVNSTLNLNKREVKQDSLLVLDNSLLDVNQLLYTVTNDDEITIEIGVPKGSKLKIETLLDSTRLKSETLDMNERHFLITFKPLEGRNILRLSLKTANNRIAHKDIIVDYKPELTNVQSLAMLTSDDNLQAFVNSLAMLASGDLKRVLLQLNLQKEGINTVYDLLDYLKKQALTHNYTEKSVDKLISQLGNHIALDNFRKNLVLLATGDLRQLLEQMNLDSLNIQNPYELITYLKSRAGSLQYSQNDVMFLLLAYASKSYVDIESFKNALVLVSDGNLKDFLKNLDLKKNNITSYRDLLEYLLKEAPNNNFTEQDILRALLILARRNNMLEMVNDLRSLSDGNLRRALDQLNIDSAHISNMDELLDYLVALGPKYGYTKNDVQALILKLSLSKTDDVAAFLAGLVAVSDGELKEFLLNIDLNKEKISTISELLEYIRKNAPKDYYNDKTLVSLLGRLAYRGNLSDYLADMRILSSGLMKQKLNNLDAKNYTGFIDLTTKLITDTAAGDYNLKQLQSLMLALYDKHQLEALLISLRQTASGNLKSYLKSCDINKLGFSNASQLFDYVLSQSKNQKFTIDEVVRLFAAQVEYKQMELFIPVLSKCTTDTTLKLWLENINLLAEHISNLPQLSAYIEQNDSNNIEFVKAVACATVDTMPVKLFMRELGLLSSTELRKTLSTLKIDSKKYKTNSEVALYLINNAQKLHIDKKELVKSLVLLSSTKITESALQMLSSMTSGNLASALLEIKNGKEKYISLSQIINHLLAIAGEKHFTASEVYNLLKSYNAKLEYQSFLSSLVLVSEGDLANAINENWSEFNDLDNPEQLLDKLLLLHDKYKYSEGDMVLLLSKLIMHGDLALFHKNLIRLANGNLKKFLMQIDLKKMNFKSAEDFITYLFENASKNGYTKDDVIQLLLKLAREQQEFQVKETRRSRFFESPLIISLFSLILLVIIATGVYWFKFRKGKISNVEDTHIG